MHNKMLSTRRFFKWNQAQHNLHKFFFFFCCSILIFSLCISNLQHFLVKNYLNIFQRFLSFLIWFLFETHTHSFYLLTCNHQFSIGFTFMKIFFYSFFLTGLLEFHSIFSIDNLLSCLIKLSLDMETSYVIIATCTIVDYNIEIGNSKKRRETFVYSLTHTCKQIYKMYLTNFDAVI